ncbi:methylated-DNA--[protein]-cysteine S-methyltransferase (plasmid) [Pseudoalteromonas xiamenensis]|uniref:methylated-DNA--[protein]-cysteine S-methyltransferase n=1 Tax=Pseudoalteromonas xiamenensis TaxID=882626 RepID=UPI0027E3E19E|nr:methylated-DNA--[protein]-cysteine S-methyltransferase [Pseudoalteromonas xiamenensis]WMN61547.1 methylated-DNA--[protein]-cysteine S-methyltransferase [Pseudoalteromonas xiamenensis]WMN62255.1 methylated-DNA--[protein]-cysteine S-methyltransferase [Pseudoalteromonas xiamenensis]
MILTAKMPSPIGEITLQATENGLCYVGFHPIYEEVKGSNKHLIQGMTELTEYFNGRRFEFEVKLDVKGTIFQRSVWQILSTIPYGLTYSYSWIANKLDNPKAVRAVGAANGKNPISFIVPCHRIIGANGTLTGYAGGINAKAWLLEHEREHYH